MAGKQMGFERGTALVTRSTQPMWAQSNNLSVTLLLTNLRQVFLGAQKWLN
jgi:hypothetical protein